MSDPIQLMVTQAGLAALVASSGTNRIEIAQVGLTQSAFIVAPTLTNLPGEFSRLSTISGTAVSTSIIHMTAQDASTAIYDLRGFGLYLADGTLFAVYGQNTPIFRKVSVATFLLALDISFAGIDAGNIEFGDTSFLMPPASETVKGVAEIATPQEAAAETDHTRIISPLTLGQRLAALAALLRAESDADMLSLANGFDALLAALTARTITGDGLVTGGGSLAANRVLSVLAASAADVRAGEAVDRAVTPAALSGLIKSIGQNGHAMLPGLEGLRVMWGRFTAAANGTTSILFPDAFATGCFIVLTDGVKGSGADSQDNPGGVDYSTITASGFTVFSADDTANASGYLALGH